MTKNGQPLFGQKIITATFRAENRAGPSGKRWDWAPRARRSLVWFSLVRNSAEPKSIVRAGTHPCLLFRFAFCLFRCQWHSCAKFLAEHMPEREVWAEILWKISCSLNPSSVRAHILPRLFFRVFVICNSRFTDTTLVGHTQRHAHKTNPQRRRRKETKMREGEVEKLRAVVRDCLGKHLYSSAIFFADKLATLAGNATQDLYMQVLTLSTSFNRLSDFWSEAFGIVSLFRDFFLSPQFLNL